MTGIRLRDVLWEGPRGVRVGRDSPHGPPALAARAALCTQHHAWLKDRVVPLLTTELRVAPPVTLIISFWGRRLARRRPGLLPPAPWALGPWVGILYRPGPQS